MDPFRVRLKHTGVFGDGRPNAGPVQISDLDTGLENQNRKVPVYVPANGFIDVPLSSRTMLSMQSGSIASLTADGLITSQTVGQSIPNITNKIIWGPGKDFETWDQVYGFIESNRTPTTIIVDSHDSIPLEIPSGVYDLTNVYMGVPRIGDYENGQVNILDGAIIKNVKRFFGSILIRGNSSSPCIEIESFPGSPKILYFDLGSVVMNQGTAPMVVVPGGEFCFAVFNGGGYTNGSPPTSSLMHVEDNGIGVIATFTSTQSIENYVISGDPLSSMILYHGGGLIFPFENLPLFNGTLYNNPHSVVGGAGTSTFRPSSLINPVQIGCQYFDSSLAIPIWWDGLQWVDITNSPV